MGRILHNDVELCQYLGVPRDSVPGIIAAGLPMLPDGTFDQQDVKEWRDNRLAVLVPEEDINTKLEKFKGNEPDLIALDRVKFREREIRLWRIKFDEKTNAEIREMSDNVAKGLGEEFRKAQKEKFEQERLLRGESTENIAVTVAYIKELKRRIHGKDGDARG